MEGAIRQSRQRQNVRYSFQTCVFFCALEIILKQNKYKQDTAPVRVDQKQSQKFFIEERIRQRFIMSL